METQHHNFLKQSSGNGNSHEGQQCQKCGWSFPNPHPSAKHRRAHNKLCVQFQIKASHADAQPTTPTVSISPKISSGVGTRSTKSEEECFTDAATDFTDGSASSSGSGDASEAVMQRFYSILNFSDDTLADAETDNTSAPNSLLNGNEDQIQTVSKLTNENDTVEAGIASQDHTSSSANGLVEKQLSKTSTELESFANERKEIISSEKKAELRTSYDNPTSKASEDVSGGPISIAKLTETESAILENDVGNARSNLSSVMHSVEVVNSTSGSTSKLSDVMEKHELKTETLNDFHVLAVPDALPLSTHPDIVVVDPEVSDCKKICSEGNVFKSVDGMDSKLNQDMGQNSIVDLNAVGEPGQIIPDIENSEAEDSKLRSEIVKGFMSGSLEDEKISGSIEEQKPVVSLEKIPLEGGVSVEHSTDHVHFDIDDHEVKSKELFGISSLADCTADESPPSVAELDSINYSKDTGNDSMMEDAHSHLEGNKNEDEDTKRDCSLSGAESREPERTYDQSYSNATHDSKEVKVDKSLLLLVGSTGTNSGFAESYDEEDQGGVLKSDLPGSVSNMIPGKALEVCEDAQYSVRSSGVNDSCTQKFVETSGVVESDRINPIKQHVAVSAVDVPDSSSQTNSLEGNWGPVSVISAVSDTPPSDTLASIHSQASPVDQKMSLEPKSVMESQTSDDPNVGVSKREDISEIHTLDEQKPKGSTSSAGHVGNASPEEKRDEEIIEKVTESTETNHTPLKTLLGEATARSRAESPLHYNQSSTSMPQTDEIPVTNNGFSKTEKVVYSSNDPTMEASEEEVGKECDSPARYPVNIKTQKKRGNSKPSWMLYFCCSSVNAR